MCYSAVLGLMLSSTCKLYGFFGSELPRSNPYTHIESESDPFAASPGNGPITGLLESVLSAHYLSRLWPNSAQMAGESYFISFSIDIFV